MSSRSSRVIALLCTLASGCAVGAGDDPAEEVAEAPEAMNGHNSLTNYALGYSALTANHRALDFLRHHGLGEALDGWAVYADYPEMRYQLHHEIARQTMDYVVSCALPAGQIVSYEDPLAGGARYDFKGEHGLCPGWLNGAPPPECLELVSACVLARVNAVGTRVPLSLRNAQLPLSSAIQPEDRYKDGAPIASFATCPSGGYGPGRSCGFYPAGVGSCTPGTTVTVGAGSNASNCAAPLGYSTQDTMLRVCKGVHGCDPTTPSIASSYAGVVAQNDDSCYTLKPSATFVCPSSGYYSVMAATYNASLSSEYVTNSAYFRVQASTGSLPASEAQVFKYVEGAFYGNIFDPENLAPEVDFYMTAEGQLHGDANYVVPTVFKKAFACYSPRWDDGMAELTRRMCAWPGGNCLMNVAGACTTRMYGNDGDPLNRCATDNASGAGDYGDCLDRAGEQRWRLPITTYLNDPCDTVTYPGSTPPSSCQRANGLNWPL